MLLDRGGAIRSGWELVFRGLEHDVARTFSSALMIYLARWISVVAHPFVLIAVWVAAATARVQGYDKIAATVGFVALVVIVPNVVFMVWQVRRGAWATVDASNRTERPLLYAAGLPTLAVLISYVVITGRHSFLLRGAIITLVLLIICAITSRWLKVSLHLASAGLTATGLVLIGSPVGWIVAAIIPALAWSRLALRKHTWMELGVGLLYGVLAGVAVRLM
jgi:hypothetical protein